MRGFRKPHGFGILAHFDFGILAMLELGGTWWHVFHRRDGWEMEGNDLGFQRIKHEL